jgi:hypothetical protein
MFRDDGSGESLEAAEPIAAGKENSLQAGLQIPRWIWAAMMALYATFFSFLAVAIGGDRATRFVLVISAGFAVIYFALAFILNSVKGREAQSPLDTALGVLETWTGPMSLKAVAGQILIVPLATALFAIAVFIILLAMPS